MKVQEKVMVVPKQGADGNEEQDRVLRRHLNFLADILASSDPRRDAALSHLRAAPAVGRELAGRLVARLLAGDESCALLGAADQVWAELETE